MNTKSIVEQAADRYLNARAIAIDHALFTFLREHGVTNATSLEDIQGALKERGLTLVREYTQSDTEEVHTFKLCKVFATTTFNIPRPHINII